ncbi:hypothetical protein QUA27_00045 [Microcoleus sp. Pol14C6]
MGASCYYSGYTYSCTYYGYGSLQVAIVLCLFDFYYSSDGGDRAIE